MMGFIDKFKAAHRVSTPLIAVRTFDAKSTIDRIKGIWSSKWSLILWDCLQGLGAITNDGKEPLQKAFNDSGASVENSVALPDALRVCSFMGEDQIVFVSNAHLFLSEQAKNRDETIQGIWNLRDKFKAKGNTLVLLTSSGAMLPPELANDFLVLDEPLPNQSELETIVNDTFEFAKLPKPASDVLAGATKALIGLPAFPAEQSTAMCLDVKAKKLDLDELWERKRQAINQTKGLTVYTGNDSIDNVGGLSNVKSFLTSIMNGKKAPNVIIFMDEIEKAFAGSGTDSSGVKTELTGQMLSWMEDKNIKGVMFNGVPGVGKSQLPKTLGNKYGRPFVHFNLSAMQDALVGNSGNYLRSAQAVIDAVSDGKVLAIATCNNIDWLPPELLSRFQLATFFFDTPTEEERASIWNVYRKQFEIPDAETLSFNEDGWTGREIKGCCEKAYMLGCSLSEAASYVVPVTVSRALQIDTLRRQASGKYLSASKPGIYKFDGIDLEQVQAESTGRKMR